MKKIILICISLMIGSIITGVIFFTQPGSLLGSQVLFQTENREFIYRCFSAKGRTVERMHTRFTKFKAENPQHRDLKLYRICFKNYLRINKWAAFKTAPEWHYEYLPLWKR